LEYALGPREFRPDLAVIHLYPGYYQPDHLFNRIEWELEGAELQGRPYTAVIIDGIHNVFLQFPEIENYNLFWPQLYASLRTRAVTIISTHTTFVLQGQDFSDDYRLDDKRSEPLRHALVQKVDFRFEIDPVSDEDVTSPFAGDAANIFAFRTVSAIGQPIPERDIYWSRESLVLFDPAQARLPFPRRFRRRATAT
jgi:low affinity Fe/Cu permease